MCPTENDIAELTMAVQRLTSALRASDHYSSSADRYHSDYSPCFQSSWQCAKCGSAEYVIVDIALLRASQAGDKSVMQIPIECYHCGHAGYLNTLGEITNRPHD